MDFNIDELKSTLIQDDTQRTIRSYSVVGKVLAADLLDMDKFQNHFLLTAASLGSQLLKDYNIGVNSKDEIVSISFERIKNFFFDILNGKIIIQDVNGKFSISDITGMFS